MSTLGQVRELVAGLPGTSVADHHGMESFRLAGHILATVPDDEHLRIMLDEPAILAVVAEHPHECTPLYWGRRLSCVVVTLSLADVELVADLIDDAWWRRAPASMRRAREQR
jgi:hypothetical protein